MFRAVQSVKDGKSHAIVSSGNTGALMVISTVLMKTIKGISRPAIASMFPTMKSKTVMLDLGANIECDLKNILDFAILGKTFSKTLLNINKPHHNPLDKQDTFVSLVIILFYSQSINLFLETQYVNFKLYKDI